MTDFITLTPERGWQRRVLGTPPPPRPSPEPAEFLPVLAVDLGQLQDYTAICLCETTRRSPASAGGPLVYEHAVTHLERPGRGTSYVSVVERVCALCRDAPFAPLLALDATGVGVAVTDMFRVARPRCTGIVPVTIVGGEGARRSGDGWHVSKLNLVATTQVAMERGRLKVARQLPVAGILTRELLAFRARVTAAGNVTYGGPDWREGEHDDVVLALAIGVWVAEQELGTRTRFW